MAHVILKVNGKSIKCSNRGEADRFSQNATKLHRDKVLRIMEREIDEAAWNAEDFRHFWRDMAEMFPNRPTFKILTVPTTR